MNDRYDRQAIEEHNTQELDQAEEDEVVEYLLGKERVDPMWQLLADFVAGSKRLATGMKNLGSKP